MVNITISVPAKLKAEMNKFPHVNWSAVVIPAIRKKLEELQS